MPDNILYYVWTIGSFGCWVLIAIGATVAFSRRRRVCFLLQMIAAMLLVALDIAGIFLWNPAFGVLRGGKALPDWLTIYQTIAGIAWTAAGLTFGTSFLLDKLSITRPSADRGFVPEIQPAHPGI